MQMPCLAAPSNAGDRHAVMYRMHWKRVRQTCWQPAKAAWRMGPSDLALHYAAPALAPWQPQAVAAAMAQSVVGELGAGQAPDTASPCQTAGSQHGYVLST